MKNLIGSIDPLRKRINGDWGDVDDKVKQNQAREEFENLEQGSTCSRGYRRTGSAPVLVAIGGALPIIGVGLIAAGLIIAAYGVYKHYKECG